MQQAGNPAEAIEQRLHHLQHALARQAGAQQQGQQLCIGQCRGAPMGNETQREKIHPARGDKRMDSEAQLDTARFHTQQEQRPIQRIPGSILRIG